MKEWRLRGHYSLPRP